MAIALDQEQLFENIAFRCLFRENRTLAETQRILLQNGIKVSLQKLAKFKKNAVKIAARDANREEMQKTLLESIEQVIKEFEFLTSETKKLIQEFGQNRQNYSKLLALREYREQLALAMKRLGELKSGISSISVDKMAIFSTDEFVKSIKQVQESWFEEMDAYYDGHRLIFRKPKPEIVERYYRWRAKKRLKNAPIPIPAGNLDKG